MHNICCILSLSLSLSDIHSVGPHTGSRLGGTLLTVTGSGFGINQEDIEVDVDGTPCQILSQNMTHIHCWTGRPHDDALSVADDNGDFSVTASGHRFKGEAHSISNSSIMQSYNNNHHLYRNL